MFLTHLQATCKEKGCKTQFIATSSHDLCRRHALCAVAVGDLIVWHPYLCDVCSRLLASQYEESQVSMMDIETDFELLKSWVSGFQRLVPKESPYILSDEFRLHLFPLSSPWAHFMTAQSYSCYSNSLVLG